MRAATFLSRPPRPRYAGAVGAELERIEHESESASKKPIEPLALDDYLAFLPALIPFLGPWLVQHSEARDPAEKQKLLWVSIGVTALAAAVFVAMLPASGETHGRLHQRIESQLNILRTIAETYRVEHESYPDAGTWRRYAERADPRFYDPWARPYRYERNPDGGVTIGTLGRDGVAGGSGDNADISASFAPDSSGRLKTAHL